MDMQDNGGRYLRETGIVEVYRVIGAEDSPYSVKVRSYFRYKGITHEWLSRHEASELFQKHARLPLIPLVVTPDERGIQDSTPIIEALEPEFGEPGIHPPDAVSAFVSALLEEFGDEWGNKWMFHLRWAREIDQIGCARRLAASSMPNATAEQIGRAAKAVRERMVDRVWFVGSNAATAPQIERSFKDALGFLEAHLADRPYLFGGRPAFADFGLWGQIYSARRDHTPRQIIEASAPNVSAWVDRMLAPKVLSEFEPWESLAPSLTPLLADQVGALFLPWSAANAAAIAAGEEEFTVELKGNAWTQRPQKYHARSLGVLKSKYQRVRGDARVNALLRETGCLRDLAA